MSVEWHRLIHLHQIMLLKLNIGGSLHSRICCGIWLLLFLKQFWYVNWIRDAWNWNWQLLNWNDEYGKTRQETIVLILCRWLFEMSKIVFQKGKWFICSMGWLVSLPLCSWKWSMSWDSYFLFAFQIFRVDLLEWNE